MPHGKREMAAWMPPGLKERQKRTKETMARDGIHADCKGGVTFCAKAPTLTVDATWGPHIPHWLATWQFPNVTLDATWQFPNVTLDVRS